MTWTDRAACIGKHHLFFGPPDAEFTAAKAICADCPVLADCLADALATESADPRNHAGLRAGLTPEELAGARRRRKPDLSPIKHGTYAGFYAHYRRGIPACEACNQANRLYQAESRERRDRARSESA